MIDNSYFIQADSPRSSFSRIALLAGSFALATFLLGGGAHPALAAEESLESQTSLTLEVSTGATGEATEGDSASTSSTVGLQPLLREADLTDQSAAPLLGTAVWVDNLSEPPSPAPAQPLAAPEPPASPVPVPPVKNQALPTHAKAAPAPSPNPATPAPSAPASQLAQPAAPPSQAAPNPVKASPAIVQESNLAPQSADETAVSPTNPFTWVSMVALALIATILSMSFLTRKSIRIKD